MAIDIEQPGEWDTAADAILRREYGEMVRRCEAQGLLRSDLQERLAGWLLISSLEANREREARAASRRRDDVENNPNNSLLQTARDAFRAGDLAEFRLACTNWLLLERGIRIGDRIVLHAWAVPSEMTLEAFELEWSDESLLWEPTLVFSGPHTRTRPNRIEHGPVRLGMQGRVTLKHA